MFDTSAIRALGAAKVLNELAGVEWKREGDWMVGLCPFHTDSSPSFKVGPDAPHRARCFSCGVQGDAVELVAKHLQVQAWDAMKAISERFQIPQVDKRRVAAPPRTAAAPRANDVPPLPDPAVSDTLEEMLAAAGSVDGGSAGAAYLSDRGVFLPRLRDVRAVDDLPEFWREMTGRFGLETLKSLGLSALFTMVPHRAGALLFACRTSRGVLTGFHVRTLSATGKPRWLFAGPVSPWPWTVEPLRQSLVSQDVIVLCEGATDALAWAGTAFTAWGVPGVAGLTPWMCGLLADCGARVLVALDDDAAGRAARPTWGAMLEAARVPFRHLDYADLGRAGVNDAADAVREDCRVELLDLALSILGAPQAEPSPAPSDGLAGPTPSDGGVAKDAEPEQETRHAARVTPPARPRADETDSPADAAPEPEPQAGRGREPPRVDDDSPLHDDDLSLANIRARLKSTSLRWTIALVHQWWDHGHKGQVDPQIVAEMVVEWFEAREGRFLQDSAAEPHLYWQRGLHHIGARDRGWLGLCYREGRINRETREGKIVLSAMESHAWAQRDAPTVQPWAFYDRNSRELAVHTHDDQDRVLVVNAEGVNVAQNGSGRFLLRTDSGTKAIHSKPARFQRAAELLSRHFVNGLATTEAERALMTTWLLTAWLRQRLNTRAIVFAQGSSGSGKSQAAKAATTLLFGSERLIDPTPAACRTEGALQPLVTLDNKESRNMDQALIQFLLLSATGITRKKRAEGTTDGIHDEQINALVLVTAIEPPGLPELASRTLTVRFRHDLQRAGFQPADELRALAQHRSTILMGLFEMFGRMFKTGRGPLDKLALDIPPRHPRERLGEHLALMAHLGGELRNAVPDIWGGSRPDAHDLLKTWLHDEAEIARDQAVGTDPIYAALSALVWSWNRLVERQGDLVRPAVADALFRCRPLYAGANDTLVENPQRGTRWVGGTRTFRLIVGFAGSYTDLHADLMRVSRDTSAGATYSDAIRSAGVLSARMYRNTALDEGGWHTDVARVTSTGRTYRFWIEPERLDLEAGDDGETPVSE